MDLSAKGSFLLSTGRAEAYYHDHAASLPIVDYHCHLSPEEIAIDKRFDNITDLWLSGDHYKWRLMRAYGCDEALITGDADPEDKFLAFADTLSRAIGNPLFHWSHLELARYFGITETLHAQNAKEICAACNEKLKDPSMSARGLITSSRVTHLCTTDDPADDLRWHREIARDTSFATKVLPAFRPDAALHIEKEDFAAYLERLSEASGTVIEDIASLRLALRRRMDFFAANGATVSDHGLDFVPFRDITEGEADAILQKKLAGQPLTADEITAFTCFLLLFLAREYAKRNWVMQLHFGVQRNLHPVLMRIKGPDAGGDAIGRRQPPEELAGFLQALAADGLLPKTVLYSLHPTDNVMIETIMGSFQGGMRGKLQHGSAWWFNDHEQGMRDHLTCLASQGMLATFVGMLTDSRSFLSYARHEYFRRILCDLIGTWVDSGRFPVGTIAEEIIRDICYHNAVSYFGFT
ncbi:MAG: glucuronate isomerase [Lachnospiraceae bacterium]|nr:glucuronate isomerase [Lachnospiraceae bacterium]